MNTNLEAVNHLLTLAIKKEKAYHAGYTETVEYSRSSKAHFAGVDIEDYLKQFARREADELFDQRKEITAHVNSSIGAMLDRPFSKVPRSNYTKVLAFDKDKDGSRANEFENRVLGAFTTRGLDHYIFERGRYLSKFDPNTFIAVEFASFDPTKEKAKPYPFEVTAELAVDFNYTPHGELEYLAVRQESEKIERFTLYRPFQTVVLQQLTKEEIATYPGTPVQVEKIESDPMDGDLIRVDGSRVFRVDIPAPHGLEVTPAIRVGYLENPEDDGLTRLGIFDAALPYARKVVKINSELDITSAFLAFPVSIRHEEPCENVGCSRGTMADGTTCIVCQGTGMKKRPTSAAEEIVLPLPQHGEEMFDVTKILHYAYPPTDAVKMQLDLMQYNIIQTKESVFNSEMFNKQQTAQTATFHGIQLQSVYDTLYPYAQNLARLWAFIARACKTFTGFNGEMTAKLIFPQDFRFETVEDLFLEMKQARDAEAGNDVTALLQDRIMERMLMDDRERLQRWRVDSGFNPFRGMTDAQILTALNSELVPKWKKVLYSNWPEIIDAVLSKNADFYKLERSRQKALIMDAVDVLQKELDAQTPVMNIGAFGDTEPQPNTTAN